MLAAQRVSRAVPQFPLSPHPALVWPRHAVGFHRQQREQEPNHSSGFAALRYRTSPWTHTGFRGGGSGAVPCRCAAFPGQSHTHNSHGAAGDRREMGVPGRISRVCLSDLCRAAWPALLFFPHLFLKSVPQFPCLEKVCLPEGLLHLFRTNRHWGCHISNTKTKALPGAATVASNPVCLFGR